MEREEALAKIEEISSMMKASNRVMLHGNTLILTGVIILLAPIVFIGLLPPLLQFIDFGEWTRRIVTIVVMLATAGIAIFTEKWLKSKFKYESEVDTKHPIIKNALSLYKPIMIAMFGGIIGMILIQRFEFIWPIVFLNIGILFQLYGRFSIATVRVISWMYLFLGMASILLTKVEIPYLQFIYLLILAISYIMMGVALNQDKKRA